MEYVQIATFDFEEIRDGLRGYFTVPWWFQNFAYYCSIRQQIRWSCRYLNQFHWWYNFRLRMGISIPAGDFLSNPLLLETDPMSVSHDPYYDVIVGLWSEAIVFGVDATSTHPTTQKIRSVPPVSVLPFPCCFPSFEPIFPNISTDKGRSGSGGGTTDGKVNDDITLILDSGANIHLFSDPELLDGLHTIANSQGTLLAQVAYRSGVTWLDRSPEH